MNKYIYNEDMILNNLLVDKSILRESNVLMTDINNLFGENSTFTDVSIDEVIATLNEQVDANDPRIEEFNKKMENDLRSLPSELQSILKHETTKFKSVMKSISKNNAVGLSKASSGFIGSCLSHIKKISPGKIAVSSILVYIIFTVNTACLSMMVPYIGIPLATVATVIVVAPLTEELAKNISINLKMSKEFLIVFNITEFSLHVRRLTSLGVKLTAAMAMRITPVIMHIGTTLVQKTIMKSGNYNGILDRITRSTLGFLVGVFLHSLINALSAFSKVNR